jgi:hypothetical protein
MPEVFRTHGWSFTIYPDDHDPPHVHVLGPGWMIKVALSEPPDLMVIIGKPTRKDARKALRQVREHLGELVAGWEKIHGRLD